MSQQPAVSIGGDSKNVSARTQPRSVEVRRAETVAGRPAHGVPSHKLRLKLTVSVACRGEYMGALAEISGVDHRAGAGVDDAVDGPARLAAYGEALNTLLAGIVRSQRDGREEPTPAIGEDP